MCFSESAARESKHLYNSLLIYRVMKEKRKLLVVYPADLSRLEKLYPCVNTNSKKFIKLLDEVEDWRKL